MKLERAIVIGGGIGGLTAAIALRRVGVDVSVFERAPVLGDVGAGITLWANATRVLTTLGVADTILELGRSFPTASLRTPTGAMLATTHPSNVDAHVGVRTVAIHRAELHAALLQALPDGTVRLGAECVAVAPDEGRVRFADGTEETANLIVAADGLNSRVRQLLFPSVQQRYSGYTAFRGVATAEFSETSETWGRGLRFGIVPLRGGRVYWFAVENTAAGVDVPLNQRRDHLLRLFGGWHDPIPHLIDATPADNILRNDINDIAPFSGWSRGRVVLLGDSVHPTTPNLGQGACMAIESAAVLAEELERGSTFGSVLQAYEARRGPRTARITNESWRIGRMAQARNPIACAIRDFVMRVVPASVAERQIVSVVAANV